MKQQELVVCRCEEVTLEQIVNTIKEHNCLAREVKLRTRAGMGYCGGRTCRCLVDRIVEQFQTNQDVHTIPLGYQPPVRPISFANLGGVKSE